MMQELLQVGWNGDRTILKLACNLTAAWTVVQVPQKYNWRQKQVLPVLPPAWNSRIGSLEVWLSGFVAEWPEVQKQLLNGLTVSAPRSVTSLDFDLKGEYLHLLVNWVVSEKDGSRTAGWSTTQSTAEKKEKLESIVSLMPATGAGSGTLGIRLVVSPTEGRAAPNERQSTDSPLVFPGGRPGSNRRR